MQAWRSLVTPRVVWHRRHSSWHLWGSHILLLYKFHICPFSHCGCNNMCNQLWSIHIYLIVINLHYFPLFFIILYYSSLFFIIVIHFHHYYSCFAVKSGTHSVVTLLWNSEIWILICQISGFRLNVKMYVTSTEERTVWTLCQN